MSLYFFSGIFYGTGFLSIFLIWIKNPFLINDATKNYVFFSFFLIIFISFIFGLIFILFKYTRNFSFQFFCIPLFLIIAEIIIAKQRHGPIGIIKTHFDSNFTKFSDLSNKDYENITE